MLLKASDEHTFQMDKGFDHQSPAETSRSANLTWHKIPPPPVWGSVWGVPQLRKGQLNFAQSSPGGMVVCNPKSRPRIAASTSHLAVWYLLLWHERSISLWEISQRPLEFVW